MRDRHRGVFVEQQLQQRAADQIGAADHDGVHALQRCMHALGEDDAPERRARRQRGESTGKASGVVGMQPVDILGGIDGVDDGFGIKRFGQRELHQNAVHGGIAIEFGDQRQQVVLRDIRRQHMLERRHAGGLRLLVLAADIDLAGGVAAHQHHRKAGRDPVLAHHPRNLPGNAGTKFSGNDFSIDDAGRHLIPLTVNPTWPRSAFATLRQAWRDRRRRQFV